VHGRGALARFIADPVGRDDGRRTHRVPRVPGQVLSAGARTRRDDQHHRSGGGGIRARAGNLRRRQDHSRATRSS
jgi:hypothetical protein